MTAPEMKIGALAQWFGSNRDRAQMVGRELGQLAWCGVAFAGGMPELPWIHTRSGVANDLHRHVINLARVVRDDVLCDLLVKRVEDRFYHPDELACAQARCVSREAPDLGMFGKSVPRSDDTPDVEWAADYFVASWMARGGSSGKTTEFTQGLAYRWTSSGGDSSKRFRSAVESLAGWTIVLRRWQFSCVDAMGFLESCRDQEGHGIYADPPWPDAGEEYTHRVSEQFQARLARRLGQFKKARVVVRLNVHPMVEGLYPRDRWTWVEQTTKSQTGTDVAEVLIVNGPSKTGGRPLP